MSPAKKTEGSILLFKSRVKNMSWMSHLLVNKLRWKILRISLVYSNSKMINVLFEHDKFSILNIQTYHSNKYKWI